jgi:molecular chaperone GrpE
MSNPEHEAERSRETFPPELAEAGEADLASQLSETKDRLLRSQAELENFRRRSRRELEDARKYAEFDLLRDLLPVLDNVLRAIQAAEKTPEAGSLLEGFRMLASQIEKVLDAHGCTPIETAGESFDPEVHEAILQQAVAGVPAGQIVGVASRGYRLHDRVVRPAQVIVARQPD